MNPTMAPIHTMRGEASFKISEDRGIANRGKVKLSTADWENCMFCNPRIQRTVDNDVTIERRIMSLLIMGLKFFVEAKRTIVAMIYRANIKGNGEENFSPSFAKLY
jgi:hypothetical protein